MVVNVWCPKYKKNCTYFSCMFMCGKYLQKRYHFLYIFYNGKYSNCGNCYASIFISVTLLPQILWLSHSLFSPLPVFKIDDFFFAKQSRNTSFNSGNLASTYIFWNTNIRERVVIHLFETTCITFPIRSAYPCTLSLQFLFHNFFPTLYLLLQQNTGAWWPSWDGSRSCFLFCCDHNLYVTYVTDICAHS